MNKLAIALVLGSLTIVGFGCSPTQRAAEEATEAAVNSQLGGNAKVNIDDNTVNYADKETGTTGSWGENASLPSNFPSDVPLYENGTMAGVTVSTDGAWVSFNTDDTPAEAVAWYADKLAADGWTQQMSYSVQGTEMRSFAKGTATITISVGKGEGDLKTMITVVRAES